MKTMTAHDIALLYFSDWEINYALTQNREDPAKVLARMANESLRGRACPEYLIETGSALTLNAIWICASRIMIIGSHDARAPELIAACVVEGADAFAAI